VNGSLLADLRLMLLPRWEFLGLPRIGGGTGIRPKERQACMTGHPAPDRVLIKLQQSSRSAYWICVEPRSWVRFGSG
jgi:hypothetical protein